MRYIIPLLSLVFLLASCSPAHRAALPPPVIPPPAPLPPPAPSFEKTFGTIAISQTGPLLIRYKSLSITVDMDIDGSPKIKGAQPGKKSMLKQGNDFVFVSTVRKSYLLEFDNGRNVFLTGETEAPEGLREFVYDLRDDGRDIYVGFFYRQASQDEAMLGQLIGLLQPENALITRSPMVGLSPLNLPTLYKALKEEFFENPVAVVTDAREIPF